MQETNTEKSIVTANQPDQQTDLERQRQQLKFTGYVLYTLALLAAVSAGADWYRYQHTAVTQPILLLGAAFTTGFVILGWWSRSKPTLAIGLGLGLYIVSQALSVLGYPVHHEGIVFKIFVGLYLIRVIGSTKEAERIVKGQAA